MTRVGGEGGPEGALRGPVLTKLGEQDPGVVVAVGIRRPERRVPLGRLGGGLALACLIVGS